MGSWLVELRLLLRGLERLDPILDRRLQVRDNEILRYQHVTPAREECLILVPRQRLHRHRASGLGQRSSGLLAAADVQLRRKPGPVRRLRKRMARRLPLQRRRYRRWHHQLRWRVCSQAAEERLHPIQLVRGASVRAGSAEQTR